tara:strand:+ start:3969 stop:4634 length:666 start_codon:yes stop_codon:yes gene_type:complete
LKVISFSLWGDAPHYNIGAVKNAQLASLHYPDWECWFYLSDNVTQSTVESLESLDNVKTIPMGKADGFRALFWRFNAILSDNVDVMICRDCDSRISQREVEAVIEWEDSKAMVHAMYDHPHHYNYMGQTILGGMWGAKKGFIDNFEESVYAVKGNEYGVDYRMFNSIMQNLKDSGIMVHSSHPPPKGWELETNPFPTMPTGPWDFVGAIFDENEEFKLSNF